MNLAYFEFADGRPELGIRFMKYALETWLFLVNGKPHPDTISLLSNLAAMLQKLELHDDALIYLSKARDIAEILYGTDSPNYIASYDTLTRAYFLKQDYRQAVEAQKVVYRYYKTKLGDADERTKSSHGVLNSMIKKAVEVVYLK
jgi:tetratricopeptide (TPR) repeat protein